jgi:hypothetical protein
MSLSHQMGVEWGRESRVPSFEFLYYRSYGVLIWNNMTILLP